jgi:amino acid transporter
MLIALVMADLGAARPESGGLIRWPYYSSGRLVATIAGWGIWIAYATNPPSESAAMLQYMSKYVSGLYSGSSLTTLGVLLGVGIMAVFVLINWFGVLLFARVNGALTVAKFVVPTLTVVALFLSGFHRANFHRTAGSHPTAGRRGFPRSRRPASSTPTPASRARSTCPGKPVTRGATCPAR